MLFNICASSVVLFELVKPEFEQVCFVLLRCVEFWTFDPVSRRLEKIGRCCELIVLGCRRGHCSVSVLVLLAKSQIYSFKSSSDPTFPLTLYVPSTLGFLRADRYIVAILSVTVSGKLGKTSHCLFLVTLASGGLANE